MHVFIDTGTYTINLIAFNNIGSDTISVTISLTTVVPNVSLPYFEDFEDTSALLCIISDINSYAEIKSSEGNSGSMGLFFAGSSDSYSGWDSTFSCESAFTINPDYSSSAILTVNTAGYDTLYLEFDMRQWLFQNPFDFSIDPSLTNFMVSVNGTQVDTCFNPSSIFSQNTWKRIVFDISPYIDTSTNEMIITFEGANLLYNFMGFTSFTNKTQIDNIRITNKLPFSAITSSTDASCNGVCDGQATVTVSNGYLPYTYLWNDDSAQTASIATGLCAGTYTVTVTDSIGESYTATVVINQPFALSANILSTPVTCPTCNDGTAAAQPSGGSGSYTYLWDDSLAQTTDTATGLAAGQYNVTVTDSLLLCGDTIIKTVTVDAASNINEPLKPGSVKIYPNPSQGYFTIEFTENDPGSKEVFVYNILGNLVKNIQSRLNERHVTIDMFDQSNGMYFIKITDEDSTVIRKIVIRY